jgi:hypothetical protein
LNVEQEAANKAEELKKARESGKHEVLNHVLMRELQMKRNILKGENCETEDR